MEERDSVKWLHRRAGFGLPPAQMRAAIDRGFAAELDRLFASLRRRPVSTRQWVGNLAVNCYYDGSGNPPA